jgi:hypothetical protein
VPSCRAASSCAWSTRAAPKGSINYVSGHPTAVRRPRALSATRSPVASPAPSALCYRVAIVTPRRTVRSPLFSQAILCWFVYVAATRRLAPRFTRLNRCVLRDPRRCARWAASTPIARDGGASRAIGVHRGYQRTRNTPLQSSDIQTLTRGASLTPATVTAASIPSTTPTWHESQ